MAGPATAIGVASPGAYRFHPSCRPQLSANVSMSRGPVVSSRSRDDGLGGAAGAFGGWPEQFGQLVEQGYVVDRPVASAVGRTRPASAAASALEDGDPGGIGEPREHLRPG